MVRQLRNNMLHHDILTRLVDKNATFIIDFDKVATMVMPEDTIETPRFQEAIRSATLVDKPDILKHRHAFFLYKDTIPSIIKLDGKTSPLMLEFSGDELKVYGDCVPHKQNAIEFKIGLAYINDVDVKSGFFTLDTAFGKIAFELPDAKDFSK